MKTPPESTDYLTARRQTALLARRPHSVVTSGIAAAFAILLPIAFVNKQFVPIATVVLSLGSILVVFLGYKRRVLPWEGLMGYLLLGLSVSAPHFGLLATNIMRLDRSGSPLVNAFIASLNIASLVVIIWTIVVTKNHITALKELRITLMEKSLDGGNSGLPIRQQASLQVMLDDYAADLP